jgi:hypothetical protein
MADSRQVGTDVGRGAAAEVVARRADLREDLLSARRVATMLDGRRVAVHDRGAPFGRVLEDHARRRANSRVVVHDQVAFLPKAERPRLHRPVLQGLHEQPLAVGLREHQVGGLMRHGLAQPAAALRARCRRLYRRSDSIAAICTASGFRD